MVSGWPEKKPKRTPQIMPETRDSKLAMLLRVASPKKTKGSNEVRMFLQIPDDVKEFEGVKV